MPIPSNNDDSEKETDMDEQPDEQPSGFNDNDENPGMTDPSDNGESPNKEDSNNNGPADEGKGKKEPVVVVPDVHPKHKEPIKSKGDRSKMRMAGKVEYDAFVTQNEIRTNPGSFVDDV